MRVVVDWDLCESNGLCMARNESRYQRVQLTAPAGNIARHIQGAEISFTPAGRR